MTAIRSSQSAYQPMSYAKTRAGVIIGVNGMNRGFRYDGLSASGAAEDLGIDAPTAAPTMTTPTTNAATTAGDATAGDYLCAYRYIDDETPDPIPSSLSPSTTTTAAENDAFKYASITASTNSRVIKVEFWRSTSGQSTTVYLDETIGHNGSYTAIADNGSGKCRFTWAGSLPHNLKVGAIITVSALTGGAASGSQTVTAITATTFDTTLGTVSTGTGTWQLTGFDGSVKSDATLQASDSMRILDGGGHLNARRFVPPPDHKPYVAVFQDRVFYAGFVPYSTGTASLSGSTVTISGGTVLSTFVGRYLIVAGRKYPITAYGSSTTFTISDYQNASFSGAAYVIQPEAQERSTICYCVDDETEVLTQRGWLHRKDLSIEDRALTLDPATDEIKWSKIKRINQFPFSGELNRWTSSRFDALTTDDHRWLASGCGIVGGHHSLRKPRGQGNHFTTTKQSQGMTSKCLIVAGGVPVHPSLTPVYSDEFVELVGWYITEGSNTSDSQAVFVSQSPTHNPEYCKQIDALADHYANKGATVTKCKPQFNGVGITRMWYFGKGIGGLLRYACPGKSLTPEFLLSLRPHQLRLLYDTLMNGDGHRHKCHRPETKTEIWSQKDIGRCDGFQMLAAMLGKRTRRSTYPVPKYGYDMNHITAYNSRKMTVCKLSRQREKYDGVVWCPTTDTGTWMARRNGITYWTGNSEQDEPESVPPTNIVTIQDNVGDDDEITGLMPSGANLYVLKDRHIYRLSFFAQPIIDVSVSLAAGRGCVNNRCWCRYEDAAYLMDQTGIFRFTGGAVESISDPIQDLFRDGTIDWSVKKWFFCQPDPLQEVIRFHVAYTTDSSTRPKRWLEYNVRNKSWSTGSALIELGGACLVNISGRTRVLVGAENDLIYLFGEGTSDHVSTATRGTVSSATSTTITDSTASFATTCVDAPLAIVAGTGKGQIRRVSVRNSGTQLTVSSAWTTTPDSTSVYLLGAIQFNMRTGIMSFVGNTSNQVSRQVRLTYEPTSADQTIDVKRYLDHNPTAENFRIPYNNGAGLTNSASDANAVLDMDRTTSSLGTNWVGFDVVPIPGRLDPDSASGPRGMRVELTGFSGDQPVKVFSLEVIGVS